MSHALEDPKSKLVDNGCEFHSKNGGKKQKTEEGEEDETGETAWTDDQEMDEEDEENFDDYYTNNEFDYEMGCAQIHKQLQEDPEYFDFQCLDYEQMLDYYAKTVDEVCKRIQVSASIAKVSSPKLRAKDELK